MHKPIMRHFVVLRKTILVAAFLWLEIVDLRLKCIVPLAQNNKGFSKNVKVHVIL